MTGSIYAKCRRSGESSIQAACSDDLKEHFAAGTTYHLAIKPGIESPLRGLFLVLDGTLRLLLGDARAKHNIAHACCIRSRTRTHLLGLALFLLLCSNVAALSLRLFAVFSLMGTWPVVLAIIYE
jgi:hypothetical protein